MLWKNCGEFFSKNVEKLWKKCEKFIYLIENKDQKKKIYIFFKKIKKIDFRGKLWITLT
jgi:hypothetical protein